MPLESEYWQPDSVSAQSGDKVKSLAEIQAEEARVEKKRWVEQFLIQVFSFYLYSSISGNRD